MFLGLTRLWAVVRVVEMTQVSLAYCIHIHSSDPVVPIIISKWLWSQQTVSSEPGDLSTGTSVSKAMGPSG